MSDGRSEDIYGLTVLPVMAAPAEYGAALQARITPLMTGIGPVEGAIALTAALLGHASISTTAKFYEHLDVHDLQAAHGKAAVVSGVLENRRKRKA